MTRKDTFVTIEDMRDKIRSQLKYELAHPSFGNPYNKSVNESPLSLHKLSKTESVRARFCRKMKEQELKDPGTI